ncbi:MAG: lipid biosynthesis acyltransferase [Firmicutes bacterium]|nr:lipid biosynthesis acyltransferase [Bacillota bacterium]
MLYAFLRVLSKIASRLPLAGRCKLGDLLGTLIWPFVPRRRKQMAQANISLSLGVDRLQADKIAKDSAVRFGRLFLEMLCLPGLTLETLPKLVSRIEGMDNLRQAQAAGRGAIVVTAHSGNWELIGPALSLHGFPMVGVAQKQHSNSDRFINECRTSTGMQIIYKTDVRSILRMLISGNIVGLLIDQDAHQDGAFVEFFGRPASTPKGAAVMARMQDVPIVPLFIHGEADGRHVLAIQEPIRMEKTADREKDVWEMTQRLTRIVENHIRQYPQQWFWLHNRWKTSPPA